MVAYATLCHYTPIEIIKHMPGVIPKFARRETSCLVNVGYIPDLMSTLGS